MTSKLTLIKREKSTHSKKKNTAKAKNLNKIPACFIRLKSMADFIFHVSSSHLHLIHILLAWVHCFRRILIFLIVHIVPHETLLVEANDHLRALDVGDARRHQIGLVRILPLHQEHELALRVCRAQNLLWYQTAFEASWLRIFLLLILRIFK